MTLALATALTTLETLAPLQHAAEWDNVGLLVEPTTTGVDAVLCTIDLDETVLEEAMALRVGLIVAYHPPLFHPLKRLTQSTLPSRLLVRAIEHRIAIWSPHTALDAAPGGVNDWLLDVVADTRDRRPIERTPAPESSAPQPLVGMGRAASLEPPQPLASIVSRIKQRLNLAHLRLAEAPRHATAPIRSVAVCAGAGGSVFEAVRDVDLLVTGELRHHDVRVHVAAGRSVVLAEHTNTERGYLPVLAARLREAWADECVVHISARDRDPLLIV